LNPQDQDSSVAVEGPDESTARLIYDALGRLGLVVTRDVSGVVTPNLAVVTCATGSNPSLLEDGPRVCAQELRHLLLDVTSRTTELIRTMQERGYGRLVLVLPDGVGLIPEGVRGGLTSFIRSAAVAHARDGIAINGVRADQALDPEFAELGRKVVFLISPEAAAMVGQVVD
jgi:hypothetical protein